MSAFTPRNDRRRLRASAEQPGTARFPANRAGTCAKCHQRYPQGAFIEVTFKHFTCAEDAPPVPDVLNGVTRQPEGSE